MSGLKILLVEDEESLARTLSLNLRLEGYEVQEAGSAAEAEAKLMHFRPDLLLLDVMLPGENGFEWFESLRKKGQSYPVIFITARDQRSDKVTGLKLGAEDYVVKPFDLEELLLRISNAVRRNKNKAEKVFRFHGGSLNFETFELTDRKGVTHKLSQREAGLLRLLTERSNKVISREEIIEQLWDDPDQASFRTIDNYILQFRKYFEKDPRRPEHFISIRSVGYKFSP
jgi:two-component system alkaline phosphatase synthesis response regulator PhoP